MHLPTPRLPKLRCGPAAPSRAGRARAVVLVAVHAIILAHVAHWKIAGSTLTPVEPSEAMQTLELGYVNAGFLLFVALILLTLVVGRFFCGWACHVVAYQDLCAWLLRRIGLRPHPVRSRVLVFVPICTALYMFAWPQVTRWLDGRDFPALVLHLTTDSFWATFPGPWIAALTVLVDGFLIVWLLGGKGFCTYGCPYGAVFGVADRFAPGRIRVTSACEQCGHCTANCTSNVRVHEEVARFGMVVDPGCMKCLDCVAGCPKNALYFGLRGASRTGAARRSKAKKAYDFSIGEEVILVLAFLVSAYAFRGLYNLVPLLLSIGLAVIAAFCVVVLLRLVRRRDLAVQNHPLKSGGRFSRAGIAAGITTGLLLAFVLHSAFVQYNVREGDRRFDEVRRSPASGRTSLARASLPYLERADRYGLFHDARLLNLLGSAQREAGDLAAAASTLERAIAIDPTPTKLLVLYGLRRQDGDLAGARDALHRLLAIDPANADARRHLDLLDPTDPN